MGYFRKQLESIAIDILTGSMEYNGERENIMNQVQNASNEILLNFIIESNM